MYLNKINLFLFISFCLIFFLYEYKDLKSEEVKIIKGTAIVIDGDTIKIGKKKIRFYGIDAPEINQRCKKIWLSISFLSFNKSYFCGEVSKDKLKDIIGNKLISCKWTNKDRYKRFIAECFKDSKNLNSWMVRNGYAVAYRKYSKKFILDEELARSDKLGLWSSDFEMPWIWRKNNN